MRSPQRELPIIKNSNCPTVLIQAVIGNGKTVWKQEPYCSYFCLNLKYPAWPYKAYIKTAKNSDFCEELISESDFEVV